MTEIARGLARAKVMLDLRRHDEAAGVLGPILAADPGNSTGWCLLALAHIGAGRFEDAIVSAGRAIAAAPDYDWPHRLACTAQLCLGNARAALRAAEEARRLSPQSWQAHVCVAEATLATGENFHLAAEAAAAARALAPNAPEVHVISGQVSFALTRRKAARAHLERALALDPQPGGALNELGRVTFSGPFRGHAARYFLRAVRVNPRVNTYTSNLDVTVRRGVGLVIHIGSAAAVVLYLATMMTHLSRTQILIGLGACVLLMTAVSLPSTCKCPRSTLTDPPSS
jgi:tetratricopeptide (TPR) repeat protein